MNKKSSALLIIISLLFAALFACGKKADHHTAFTNVKLVPMTGEIILESQTVVVKGSRIIQIGNSDELQLPENTIIIVGEDHYLMPGLADMHMHTREDWEDGDIWPVNPLYLYLANGVTTIRDFAPYGSLTYALQRRDEIQAGTRVGPAIYTSGKLLFSSPLEDPHGIVSKNFSMGFDFLKLYSYLSEEDFQAAMRTAKDLGMYTSGHIPYAVGLEGVLAEGTDEIAHVEELLFEFFEFDRNKQLTPKGWIPYIIDSILSQLDLSSSTLQADFEKENIETLVRIVEQIRSADVPVCTTMIVDDFIQLKLFQPEVFLERPENIYFEKGYVESFLQGEEKHQVICREVEDFCAFKYDIDRWTLGGLHDAGILLLLGTDAGTGGMGIVPGYSIHDELRILVENGFSPYEAIATGTVNAAVVIERMTGEGDFGTIEVGKKADLILVRGNPLADVGNIKETLGVMAAGRWYSGESLSKLIEISRSTE